MNRRLKSIIAATVTIMIFSQVFVFQKSMNVKAADEAIQTNSKSSDRDSLGGFKLISKKFMKDMNCDSYVYKHVKSGTNLIFVDDKNEEKWFVMNFRTLPKDNTGINHVIEHSTAGSSKNFPVKSPIKEFGKQSLMTYATAQTTTESTVYPVASKNERDFENLINIKLDSVFYPNFIKDKKMFQQEAWRYELDSAESELKYNGTVYNEEKGNYSDPNFLLYTATIQSLFPDTVYKFEPGGNPEGITKLSYENFLKTYKEYYTPDNCYLYVSGKVDIDKILKSIGEKYLNNFDKKDIKIEEQIQMPFNERKIKTAEYSIPKGEDIKDKCYLSSNYVVDTVKNNEVKEGFSIIQMLLSQNPSSPLIKALKDNGLSGNLTVNFDIEYFQPIFSVSIQNTNESEKDKFQKVIDDTLKDIVKNGFDKNLIDSTLTSYELSNHLKNNNPALTNNYSIMKRWMHGGDPLDYSLDIPKLKKKIEEGYLQSLIKQYLLDNKHTSMVVLKPTPGLQESRELEIKRKLESIKASFSKEKIDELVKETKEFKAWVEEPDSKEVLTTIPRLTREDIDKKAKEYKTIEKNENGVRVLYHPMQFNNTSYIKLCFDSSTIPQENIGYLSILNELLTKTDTKNYNVDELNNKLNSSLTELQIMDRCYIKNSNSDVYYPKEIIGWFCLNNKLDENFQLIKDIMYNSNLSDKKKLKEIISQLRKNTENNLMYGDYGQALDKAKAYMSESGKYNDFKNESLYSFLCDLDENFDSKSDEIVKNLEAVRNLLFNKQDMIVMYTGAEDEYDNFAKSFKEFSDGLKSQNVQKYKYVFDNSKINQGIITPSDTEYVVKGGNLNKTNYKLDGKFLVLKNILENEYLLENVVKKGGAYTSYILQDSSNVLLVSSRDPNLKESIDTFDKMPQYIKNFKADENQMNDYIIGTIGKLEKSNDWVNKCRGVIGDSIMTDEFYMTDIKQADLQKQREEILSTTSDDIRNFAPIMDALLKQNYISVVGGEAQIEKNRKNFVTIKNALDSKSENSRVVDMEKKEKTPVNKSWIVKFSKDLDPLTVNTANVYILDEENHKVKVKISYDKDSKSIKVEPETSYQKNKKYNLFIKDIQSVERDGIVPKLIAPMSMEFTTEK